MATDVVMPQMGESIAEGTITKWLVKVGDSVERDQPLFEISTDKVDAEIPSPASGTLLEVLHQEGETVGVDKVVARIGGAGEAAAPAPVPAAAAAAPEAPAPAAPAAAGTLSEEERLKVFSSPVVRKIAQEEGVDLSRVEGTGAQGRVTKKDILSHLEARPAEAPAAAAPVPSAPAPVAAPPTPAPAPVAAPAPPPAAAPMAVAGALVPAHASPIPTFFTPAYGPGDNVEIEPMSRIREITAAHMIYSKHTSAHVTTVFEMDMSNIHRVRERVKRKFEETQGTKLTFMPFLFQATVAALKAFPKVNAAIDGHNVVFKKDVNLGMAVAMDRGLIVPVIKNADQLSLVGLAKAANDLADRARTKKLKPEETQGGTFTITNPGGMGTLFGTPVINQPQVAILGIGAFEKRPVVVTDAQGNDALAIRTMSYITLTYDHRLIDGADGSYFLAHIKKTLEHGSWPELDAF